MYQNSWLDYTGTGNPYAGVTATPNTGNVPPLTAGSGGGKKFDREKLKALAPVISMALAALFSPKGYRGIGAGSAAQTSNVLQQQEEERKRYEAGREGLLAQQEEERKRYEAEQARQARLDEMTRIPWEQEQEERARLKELGLKWLMPDLGAMGKGTSGTEGVPAVNYLWNAPGYPAHVTPEDRPAYEAAKTAGTMPVNQSAVAAVLGTPGDPLAKMWENVLKQSGGASWAVTGALQYYQASKMPKGEKRAKTLFEGFSKGNKNAVYALANYGAMTNEELDTRYDAAIKEEAGLRGESLNWAKFGLEKKKAGEGGAGGWDPNKIYYGTPFVQQWNKKYEQYLRQEGEVDTNLTKEEQMKLLADIASGKKKPKKVSTLTLEQWFKGQKQGADFWSQYAAESGILGDPFYETPAGQIVTKYGDISKAILEMFSAEDTAENRKTLQQLIDRYNSQHAKDKGFKPHDIYWWRDWASKGAVPAQQGNVETVRGVRSSST